MSQKPDITEKKLLLECVLQRDYGCISLDKYSREVDCKICLVSMKDEPVMVMTCGHLYHHDCIFTSILDFNDRKCPECSMVLHPKRKGG